MLSKRRNRQLPSDSSSNSSPEPKKPRECDITNSPDSEHGEEDDYETLCDSNMAESFQWSLQDILNKLEKLDVIEEAVNKLRTSFEKLERRIQSLKDTQTTTKRDVEDLKESLNSNEEANIRKPKKPERKSRVETCRRRGRKWQTPRLAQRDREQELIS